MNPLDRVYGPEYPPEWDREPSVTVRPVEYPCPGCDVLFVFYGMKPDDNWRCRHCIDEAAAMDELGAHMYEMEKYGEL